MAEYKVVNAEELDAKLTGIADEVRELGDTEEKMSIEKITSNLADANEEVKAQTELIGDIKTVLSDLDDGLTAMSEEVSELVDMPEEVNLTTMTEGVAAANGEIVVQSELIEQIKDALQGKAISGKEEQVKTMEIIENGNYTVEPDEGYTLSSVHIDVNVEDNLKGLFLHTLKEINIMEEFKIGQKRLQCSSLERFSAPNLNDTSAPSYTFYGCGNISYIDFGRIIKLSTHAINGCHKITTVIFRNPDAVVSLDNVFTNNNSITRDNYTYYCNFYVPKALIEEYKSATNWSTYADRFRAIEDYPEITGGII